MPRKLIKHISGYECESASREEWIWIRERRGEPPPEDRKGCPVGWGLDSMECGEWKKLHRALILSSSGGCVALVLVMAVGVKLQILQLQNVFSYHDSRELLGHQPPTGAPSWSVPLVLRLSAWTKQLLGSSASSLSDCHCGTMQPLIVHIN